MSDAAKRFLYCPDCKEYPDKIYEIQRGLSEKKWIPAHGGYVEIRDVWKDEGPFCSVCKTLLIDESEQNEDVEH